jgi:hypothetical protein
MKIILVYNSENSIERNKLEELKAKFNETIIATHDFRTVRNVLPVSKTPSFVIIREDLEGDELLEGDLELKIEAEIEKIRQDEEMKIHGKDINRLDNLVNRKIKEEYEKLANESKIKNIDIPEKFK